MRSICSIIIKRALALLLALSLLCPSAALAATMDQVLSLGMISVKTVSLNPLTPEEREFQSLTALIYEGLYYLDDDYKPRECLAKECNYTSDGKHWTIRLRPDAVFHDGSPCTAYDVEATINEILRLAQEGRGQYNQLQYVISSVSVNSADSLQITVKRPYFGVYFALTFPVLPRDQVQSSMPAGTGPYKVDEFSPGNELYLSANENWWNGTPEVKAINVSFRATNRELISDYENNRVDAAITRSASAGQYQTGLTNLNITYRTRQLETLLLNHSANAFPLNDPKIREAVRYAIDFDAIANSVYMGMADRTDTPLPAGTWMYKDNESAYAYNPDKARQLLDEAGWKPSAADNNIRHTVVEEKGKQVDKRLRLGLYVYEEQNNSVRVQVAGMIADYLAAVGINVHVETQSFASVTEHLKARNFDMAIAAFQMDVVPDPGFLLMSGNTGNYCGYKSTAMDNLFKKLREERDFYNYQQLLWQIQDQFAQDCPFICMWYRCGALLTRKVFTTVRDVREPEILRGIESVGK
ncbi:MAG: peptide ABC transporter substrate-binding protein [Clostridia bacterium]|nr:peptide ABC transporter substrate-binding protein [Clostridia bacterium]